MVPRKISFAICAFAILCACRQDATTTMPDTGNFPKDIAGIILNKCSISGCHNSLSYANAAGLDLTTWDNMFKGSSTGAAVIPYRPDFSPLCYFTNTFPDYGIALQPTMPLNSHPLTREEYLKIRDWITKGAPAANGQVMFAENPNRDKIYVGNRLCDVVTVIDATSLLQMRYVDVGGTGNAKYPYCVKTSPDKKNWYVTFYSQTNKVQKFNAANDQLESEIYIGEGAWHSFVLSADSKYAWFVDNSSPGKVAYVDVANGVLKSTYTFSDSLKYPVGIALNEHLKKMYVGAASGNFVYSIDIANPVVPSMEEMPIDGTSLVQHAATMGAAELLAVPENNRCYVACAGTGGVMAIDMVHDTLVGKITLGTAPAYMAHAGQTLFITCPDDVSSFIGKRGAVAVVDMNTNAIIKRVYTGYQPYGIAIDGTSKMATVANANISSAGPASHHESGCGKKNGNVSFIDIASLTLIPGKTLEVAVFPYAITVR